MQKQNSDNYVGWFYLCDWRIQQLKYYLNLPQEIALLELKIKSISAYFYATHSIIGSGVFDDPLQNYQRALSVEYCITDIIGTERAYEIEKNRLIRRLKLFNEGFTDDEIKRLSVDLYADLKLLEKAFNWLDELEYYHQAQSEEREEEKTGIDDETKAEVNNLETELFELFGV
ncbi:hypothetical protein IU403_05915 [Aerococcaceae bacterium zg-BR22]|uniref:hypothetical protein n=1 Tax=Aerococcaceae bacterium zg-1292 TaxID=2774330 RepID=UPI0040641D21|nr:hypothetical protein [Aerococcaceae bacterium zg-BR22]